MIKYLFRHSWKLLLFVTMTGIIGGLSSAGLLMVINEALSDSRKFGMLAWIFFGLCLVQLMTKTCSSIMLMRLAQSMVFQLRVTLSRKLLNTPLKRLQALGKHGLFAILTNDVNTLVSLSQILPVAIGNGIVVVACLAYMAWLSWQVFLILTAGIIIGAVFYTFAERTPLQLLSEVRDQVDVLYRHFRSLVEGSKELKLNAQRGSMFVDRVIAPSAMDYQRSFVRAMTRYTWVENIGDILFYVAIGVLLFVIPLWFPQQAEVLRAVTFTALYLISPISALVGAIPELRQVSIAVQKIQQLDNALSDSKPLLLTSDPFSGNDPLRLELRGACHDYVVANEDNPFMLGPVDLTVHQGEILFFIGGNGSGKTTLAMLLLGLYEPERGSILLNGVPVTEANRENYRQYFSAVFSDFHLFEHLLDTCEDDLNARATDYITKLGMAHKVRVSDGKFSTIDLSSGQRKRLALVSSYLEDRPIYIFDEWAADQDPVFKRVFYTELLPELKARGKIVIVISHDDAYFDCADHIVKLEDGRLHSIQMNHVRTESHAALTSSTILAMEEKSATYPGG